MFFENLGRLAFSRIRPQLIYVLLSAPLIFSGIYLFQKMNKLDDLEYRYKDAILKGKKALDQKEKKEQFLLRYAHSIPYFLDQNIESLRFLQNEEKEISDFLQHPALSDKAPILKRIAFIQGDENRLSFTEEAIRNSPLAKETEEKQRHPVQMDESDFKTILSIIEDVPIDSHLPAADSPQMIITDLSFRKIAKVLNREILEVEMKILKREFNK